jgi:hypothetical protein
MATARLYDPHPAQTEIHAARDYRFRTVCCGRRFGKTLCLAAEVLDRALQEPGNYAWVAPTYLIADRGVEALRRIAPMSIRFAGRLPVRGEIHSATGSSTVWFLSADNPENIRSFGFRGVVLDEAARIPLDVWQYIIRPTISDSQGWAVFISTPRGRNWFYDLFTRGHDPLETQFASFHFPSNANPHFPPQEWEDARRELPADVFRQEYMAEFLEDSAGVFGGIDACLMPTPSGLQTPDSGLRTASVGCDLAKHTDFTVLVALDAATGQGIAMERFNHLDWPIQKERIVDFVRKHRGRLYLDSTGIGDPIYDDLKLVLPAIEPYRFTAPSKVHLIQRLAVAIEQQQVRIPADWRVLIEELRRFEYALGPSGQIAYGAPAGYHDDCVIAMALAYHGCWQAEHLGHMAPLMPAVTSRAPAFWAPDRGRGVRPLLRRPARL